VDDIKTENGTLLQWRISDYMGKGHRKIHSIGLSLIDITSGPVITQIRDAITDLLSEGEMSTDGPYLKRFAIEL
jgi:hypothetical protein